MKKILPILLVLITVFMSGCMSYYTEHIDPSLKTEKIIASKIAVFPVHKAEYAPPSSCMSTQGKYTQTTLTDTWNEKLQKKMNEMHPNVKWNFVKESDDFFSKDGQNLTYVLSLVEDVNIATVVQQAEVPKPIFEELPSDDRVAKILSEYSKENDVDYALFVVQPSLQGEIHTSTSYNVTTGMSSSSSQTYYTAQFKILIWDCNSGKLLYNSGVHQKSGSSCLVTPDEVALNNSTGDFLKHISRAVNFVLRTVNKEYKYVELEK